MPDNEGYSRSRLFFWKIPGDIPGWGNRADPFQGVRSPPSPDYQLIPRSAYERSSGKNSEGNKTGGSDRTKRSLIWTWGLLLLLMLFLGAGFYYFGEGTDNNSNKANIPTQDKGASEKQKIFEIFLGKPDKDSKTTLRVINHVVVKGDTLWDIANTYVKDPFRYPELAELSRIKNPDLIYPYNIVRIHIYESVAPE